MFRVKGVLGCCTSSSTGTNARHTHMDVHQHVASTLSWSACGPDSSSERWQPEPTHMGGLVDGRVDGWEDV